MSILKNLDDSPSNLNLKFDRVSAYISKTSGFLSLLAYVSIICIAGYKVYDVIAMNHLYVSE